MGFSGAVKLTGLDDHITPSQACVIALDDGKIKAEDFASEEVQIHSRREAQPAPALRKDTDGKSVKINLQDCLACSGCITTAETVLLQQQSLGEFMARLSAPGTATVVSVSPQTRASLAVYYGLQPAEAGARLSGFLKSIGVHAVLDLSSGRNVSLVETAAEFCHRFRAASPSSPPPSSGQHHPPADEQQPDGMEVDGAPAEPEPPCNLPMLASACPGWVCYAEKTHGSYVLPHISTAKSPQAVVGTLVKRQLAARLGAAPGDLFHCALQPCFDKKLEASRDDFEVEEGVKETDCVLSTLEVVELLESKGVSLGDCSFSTVDSLERLLSGGPSDPPGGGDLNQPRGWPGGSGGYLDFVYRVAAKELFGVAVPPGPLPYKTLRNVDYREVTLEVGGRVVLRFALAYGFRNIQTLMRKIKRNQCEFHYIEIMACPSGCLNGGGQLRPKEGQSPADLLQRLDETYHHQDLEPQWPGDSQLVKLVYGPGSALGQPFSAPSRALFHTQYHHREKTITTAISDW